MQIIGTRAEDYDWRGKTEFLRGSARKGKDDLRIFRTQLAPLHNVEGAI